MTFVVGAALVLTIAFVSWVVLRIRMRVHGSVMDAPVPTALREPDGLYRGGTVIGRVEGATVDEAARTVHFARMTGTVNILNLGPETFLFRRWQLRCLTVESMTGSPPAPYLYEKVTCSIVGLA